MNISRKHDTYFSISLLIAVVVLVLIFGDAMYIGIWYYLLIPIITLLITWGFKSPPLFQTGAVLGLSITFLIYLSLNWNAERPEGLLGLGHLFSLPGAAIGLVFSAYFLKMRNIFGASIGFTLGLFGVLVGFFMNQVVVCNTVMWCGLLSL